MNRAVILLCILGVASCNKPLPDYKQGTLDYTISGLRDTTVPSNDKVYFSPKLTLLQGNPSNEPITVTYKGLPANVVAGGNGATFRLNYSYTDSFVAHNAVQGIYPVQAVFTS